MKVLITGGAGFVGSHLSRYFFQQGGGKNTRDFVSIDGVVQSVSSAMKKINGKKGNVYNIAMARSVSLNELAKLMILLSGKKLNIKHTKPKLGDIKHSEASIGLVKKDLGIHLELS